MNFKIFFKFSKIQFYVVKVYIEQRLCCWEDLLLVDLRLHTQQDLLKTGPEIGLRSFELIIRLLENI